MKTISIIFVLMGVASTCLGDTAPFAWQETKDYRPPCFESFFPDNGQGGEHLDALWKAKDRDSRSDKEILAAVRNGLRCTKQHRTSILRWIGNRYIWGKSPQDPFAIEIMYHASDFSGERADPYGTRHYAVYFGLSVVQPKPPPILRALTDLCMRVDDPNDLGRVAWGARSQRDDLLKCLQPYLTSDDESTCKKAQILERIFKGELKAFEWATDRAKERAKEKYAEKLPEMRRILETGDSQNRREVLRLILHERIALIMDDSFVDAFAACASDPDHKVRNDVARIVGGRWVWSASSQDSNAIDLMLRLSTDEDRQVRYNAVYYGLSTVRQKDAKVARRLLEMAFEDRERNLYGRIAWGLTSERSLAARLLDEYMNSTDARVAQYAREVYRDMVGKNPVTEAEPDAEGLEPTARTPRLSPDVRHGEDNR